MDEHFYIRMKGRVQGPFTPGELRERSSRQLFSRLYEISTDGETWVRATSRPELFPAVKPQELPPKVQAGEVEPDLLEPELEPELPPDSHQEPEKLDTWAPDLWFYTQDSQEFGPADFSHLAHLIRSGQVSTEEYAWTDGMQDWSTIAEIPRLSALFGRTTSSWSASGAPRVSSGHAGAAITPTTSSLAVTSLVMGLLGFNLLFFVGSILAIVFGHSALRDIRESDGRVGGAGMATAGLVLGYAVLIGSLVTLIGLLFLVLLAGERPAG